jgi:hydroxyacylglutathione hydrolase
MLVEGAGTERARGDMALIFEQFICRSDNFGVLVHDPATRETASIDAPEFGPIKERLDQKGWKLDRILTTHHHGDHVEANLALKKEYGCTIIGPADEAAQIPGIDRPVRGGDSFKFGGSDVRVLDTPGHTLGHISYWMPDARTAFVADTLFAMGCGRLLEGTPEMMWPSLQKIAALPDETVIYCGHEYTAANARFALSVEPENVALVARAEEVRKLREAGKVTLPTTVAAEKRTNPFLRENEPAIRARLGLRDAGVVAVFAELRRRKDNFG